MIEECRMMKEKRRKKYLREVRMKIDD